MNKNFFIDLLEEKDEDLEKSMEYWNARAKGFYEHAKNNTNNSSIDFLKQFIDLKDNLVLDVGFGPGRYLKLLSEEGAILSGVELSDEMIKYAKKLCLENGIDIEKMEIYNLPWEDIDLDKLNWNNKFDLVFASKSPALNSYRSIKKLIAASKKGVFCSTYISKEEDIFLKLYKDINGIKYESTKDSFWSIYNILYLEGYYPNVKIEDRKDKAEFNIEGLIKRYAHRLFSSSPKEKDLIDLKRLIKKYEVNGKISVNIKRKEALMYFEVK